MSQSTSNELIDLVERVRSGDSRAESELHRILQPQLLGFLHNRGVNTHDIDDLSQEVWLKVTRSLEQFKTGNFRAWFFTIVHSCLTDFFRSSSRRKEAQALADDSDFVQTKMEQNPLVEHLTDCLREVGSEFVEVVRLIFEGHSASKLAVEMDVTVNTIYTRNSRGKEQLRDCIERKLQ
jgi:RNA polymerase sigma-70 factor (ECF subfamily)